MAAVPPPPSKAPPPGVATPGAKKLPPSVPGSKTPSPLAGSQSFAPPPASKQPPSGVKSLQTSQSAAIPPSTSAPLPPASYNSNNNNLNQTPKSSATTGASAPSPAPAPVQQQQQQASGTYNNNTNNNNNATTSSSSNNPPPQRPPPSQQQQQASASASASRSGSASAGAGPNNNLSTIKVRNIQSSLMYHLMFEGDISALNGSQLRQHVEGVSGIPSDKQILSYRGRTIGSMTTGADLGLTNGATLNLEVAGNTNDTSMMSTSSHQQRQPSPARSQAPRPQPRGSAVSNTNASRSGSTAGMNYSSKQQQYVGGPEAMTISHRDDYQSSLYQRHEPYQRSTQRGNYSSYSHQQPHQHHQMVGMSSNNTSRNNFVDDYDDDVVVDVIEESDAPALNPEVGPGFVGGDAVAVSQFRRTAADVEEQRLQQQEYIWKLEQVRFETERLNREREMKRQLMELEYEASLLDRDRVELERHTAMEKQKLHHVMSQNRIEMDILQKFFPGQQM